MSELDPYFLPELSDELRWAFRRTYLRIGKDSWGVIAHPDCDLFRDELVRLTLLAKSLDTKA